MSMQLRKITDQKYINVGDGNITSVIGGGRETVINFVGTSWLSVDETLEGVVRALSR